MVEVEGIAPSSKRRPPGPLQAYSAFFLARGKPADEYPRASPVLVSAARLRNKRRLAQPADDVGDPLAGVEDQRELTAV